MVLIQSDSYEFCHRNKVGQILYGCKMYLGLIICFEKNLIYANSSRQGPYSQVSSEPEGLYIIYFFLNENQKDIVLLTP